MLHPIAGVEPDSIAQQLGIEPGDVLVSINGDAPIDWIDYQSFCAVERIALLIRRGDEETEYLFEKDEYEGLGLRFESQLMSPLRECANRCLFCFVDQLPEHARPSMRVKDDDWRLSLMMGNFVTLTNVSDRELQRIIERKASPLYISVHATDPEVRARLLGRSKDRLMDQLGALVKAGLSFHAQAVICPGLNDGAVLQKTIGDLVALIPHCRSLALVPVGLTGMRDGLYPLTPFDKEGARAVLLSVGEWQRKCLDAFDTRFVYAADEFYLLAGAEVPKDMAYEDYPQIENGVGLLRLLETEFSMAYEDADLSAARPARLAIATGVSAAGFLRELIGAHPIPGVEVSVHALTNRHFGPSVTVAGLLTGGDLVDQMKEVVADALLITESMLRAGEDVFLDDMTRKQVEAALQTPIIPVGARGEDLLDALMLTPIEPPARP